MFRQISKRFNVARSRSITSRMTLTPPFYPKPWDHTPEQIRAAVDDFIARAKKLDDDLAAIPEPTVENFVEPMALFLGRNSEMNLKLSFYRQISSDAEVRKASQEAVQKKLNFYIESQMRTDLYSQFKKVLAKIEHDETVDAETKKYVADNCKDFRRSGLELPLEKQKQFEQLSKEISDIVLEHRKNINELTEHLLFTKEELDGIPESILKQYKEHDGKLLVTFKPPDIVPVIKYSHNPETRKKAFLGSQNKVSQNGPLLKEVAIKREKLAKTLGYRTYSEYILEERMAKTPEAVMAFENDLRAKLHPKAEKERDQLLELKKEILAERGVNDLSPNKLLIWDLPYLLNILLERQYQVDEQKIKEFFPLEATIDKMLQFYEELFNLKFVQEVANATTWHPDVKQFAVWKLEEGQTEFMGWIYFDLHPRDGKYNHAACFTLKKGYFDKETGVSERPIAALVTNFSKPQNGNPALLKHREVQTFFHELGHGIHNLVSVTKYSRFQGTAVARDFVECPSKMLEFWVWTSPELKRLSSHYKTGEPLDENLIKRMVEAKHLGSGLLLARQVHLGIFDMLLHNTEDVEKLDIDDAWNRLREEISLTSMDGETCVGYATFSHTMSGYSSGYYGYQWSNVFASDIYHSMFAKNPFDKENGKRYRDIILKRGGSRDEMDNLVELLGREPNSDAYMLDIGLGPASEKL